MRVFFQYVCLVAIFGIPDSSAFARPVEDWKFERLFKEADLVVLAEALEYKDVDDQPVDNLLKKNCQAQNTSFAIARVIQGAVTADKITLLHFRLIEGVDGIDNGPLLVTFRTESAEFLIEGTTTQLGKPTYLLFLKKRKDGRYEPVSGQVDSKLSVREMYIPPDKQKSKRQ